MRNEQRKTTRPDRMTLVIEGEANDRVRQLSHATGMSSTRLVNSILSRVELSDVPAPQHKYGGLYVPPACYPYRYGADHDEDNDTVLSIRSSRVPEFLMDEAIDAAEWNHEGDVHAYLTEVMCVYLQADPTELSSRVDKFFSRTDPTYCTPSAFKTVTVEVPTPVVASWAGTHMPDVELIRALIFEGLCQ